MLTRIVLSTFLFAAVGVPIAQAQDAPPAAAAEKGPKATSIWDLIVASGTIGYLIIGLSVAAVALIVENLITLRRAVLAPRALAKDLHALITQGDFREADKRCKECPCYLSHVVQAGLLETRLGYPAVEKAMEDASHEQAARLFRKVEYLALIGNIGPMLGLLGTVYGLVLAFKTVAESQGMASAADLADGIYLALITTVEGLVVAIPALSAYAIFKSRIEQLASEASLLAEQVFVNYKRQSVRRAAEPAENLF